MNLPSNTCPDIDEVIKCIKDAISGHYNDESTWGWCIATLEELRDANTKLRGCAEHYKNELDEAFDAVMDRR